MAVDVTPNAQEIEDVINLIEKLMITANISHIVGGMAMAVILSRLKKNRQMNFIVEEVTMKPKLELVKPDASSK